VLKITTQIQTKDGAIHNEMLVVYSTKLGCYDIIDLDEGIIKVQPVYYINQLLMNEGFDRIYPLIPLSQTGGAKYDIPRYIKQLTEEQVLQVYIIMDELMKEYFSQYYGIENIEIIN